MVAGEENPWLASMARRAEKKGKAAMLVVLDPTQQDTATQPPSHWPTRGAPAARRVAEPPVDEDSSRDCKRARDDDDQSD